MAADPILMIEAMTALATMSVHTFVLVSKEPREWRKGDRHQASPPTRPIKADRHGG